MQNQSEARETAFEPNKPKAQEDLMQQRREMPGWEKHCLKWSVIFVQEQLGINWPRAASRWKLAEGSHWVEDWDSELHFP